MLKITSVAGARPNFVKLAPFCHAVESFAPNIKHRIINTNQHHDSDLNEKFFSSLNIPEPDFNCKPLSGSVSDRLLGMAEQISDILKSIDSDWVIVYGDVLSTAAGAIAAKFNGVRLAHYGSGVRSGDLAMPEEFIRRLVDSITDLHLVSHESAANNLLREGVDISRIKEVGNLMVDTLHTALDRGHFSAIERPTHPYCILTLHRPETVDDPTRLSKVFPAILKACAGMTIVFPIHPRTRERLGPAGFNPSELGKIPELVVTGPLPYLHLINLLKGADLVVTDSAGLREEAFALNVPCATIREQTEWPDDLILKRNRTTGYKPSNIIEIVRQLRRSPSGTDDLPWSWDGAAAYRMVRALQDTIATPR